MAKRSGDEMAKRSYATKNKLQIFRLSCLNRFGDTDQLFVRLNLAKKAERSEAKNAKRSFESKYF